MLKSVVLVAALASALSAGASAQSTETLRVGMSGGYFPFTFVRQDKLQGFEVDVMNAVGKETGLDIDFETMSFSGLVGALESGRIDTIANQITITPEREAKFAFTQPYVFDGAQVVVKKGQEGAIKGPEDLKGRTVAVNLGSNFEQLLEELPYADEIKIKTYENNIAQDVALGRVDAFVMDRVSSVQLIAKSPLPLALAGKPFNSIRNALPFRDDEAGRALRDKVDDAMSTLHENGTLAKISDEWFDSDITVAE